MAKRGEDLSHAGETILAQASVERILQQARHLLQQDGSLAAMLFIRLTSGENGVLALALPLRPPVPAVTLALNLVVLASYPFLAWVDSLRCRPLLGRQRHPLAEQERGVRVPFETVMEKDLEPDPEGGEPAEAVEKLQGRSCGCHRVNP